MASNGTKMLMFFITVHVLFFYAGEAGIRPHQTNPNPHEQALNQYQNDSLQDTVGTSSDSGIFDGSLGIAGAALEGINTIGDIIFSPYTIWDDTEMPEVFLVLFRTIFGILEIVLVVSWIRGVVF